MLHIVTEDEFVRDIDYIMFSEGASCMEAICTYSELHDIEFAKLVPFIESTYKNKLREEAESRNMLKAENTQIPI